MIRLGKFVHIQCKRRTKWCDNYIFKTDIQIVRNGERIAIQPTTCALSQLMFNSTHLLTKPSTSLLMRHTHRWTDKSKPIWWMHTGARAHTHKQTLVSVGGQRGKRLVCRSCSCSLFSIHQPFQTLSKFTQCHISHDRVTLWMSAGPRFCMFLSNGLVKEKGKAWPYVCVWSLTISHFSGTLHHRSEVAHVFLPASCLRLTPMRFTQKLQCLQTHIKTQLDNKTKTDIR